MSHPNLGSLMRVFLAIAAGVAFAVCSLRRAHSKPGARLTGDHRRAQQLWQQRWEPLAAVTVFDIDAPAQSSEARLAVARALAQPIPPRGDGRRGGYDNQQNVKRESATVRSMLAEDGLWDWRPDPALLPPQAAPGASMDTLLAAVPAGGGIAWLAFGNAGVAEMLMNWVSLAQSRPTSNSCRFLIKSPCARRFRVEDVRLRAALATCTCGAQRSAAPNGSRCEYCVCRPLT